MVNTRIGIVEDDDFTAYCLRKELEAMGYFVLSPCSNYDQAVQMLQIEKPDLVILDINLKGSKDGIEVAKYIRDGANIPIIFLSASVDKNVISRAKTVKPNSFLEKPFKKTDLYMAIELAVEHYQASSSGKGTTKGQDNAVIASDSIFIKEGNYYFKVRLKEILYLTTENVYINLFSTERRFVIRNSLGEFMKKLDTSKFVRIHQRHVVNIDEVEKINSEYLLVRNVQLPISKNYRQELLRNLNLS